MPGRVIVRQGRALCFQQVTGTMGRCECAWSISVPGRVNIIVGQGPALGFQQVTGRWEGVNVLGRVMQRCLVTCSA